MSTRFEESLLEAGRREVPDAARKAAARAALLGAVATGTDTGADTASATSTGGGLAFLKIVGLAALVVGGSTLFVATRRGPELRPEPVAAATAERRPTATASSVTTATPADRAAVPVDALPSAAAPEAARSNVPARAGEEPDPLVLEARLLEEARTCLASRDLVCARARLEAHDRRFAGGPLADEAALLGVDVARARGDRPRARALAEELLRRAPRGPYAQRAREALRALETEEEAGR